MIRGQRAECVQRTFYHLSPIPSIGVFLLWLSLDAQKPGLAGDKVLACVWPTWLAFSTVTDLVKIVDRNICVHCVSLQHLAGSRVMTVEGAAK